MATKVLQTPYIHSIIPFDPSLEYTVDFSYSDNQSVKNRAVITDNATSSVVYDATQTTMRLQHNIPINTLVAGNQYLIQIQVFDEDGNSSNLSAPVLFYCLSTPIFEFDSITNGMTHKNASIALNLNYSQTENEVIRSFQFLKYSSNKVLLESSNVFYSTSTLSHSFYGLDNNTMYYFRAIGETSRGITLDTGYIQVNTAFNTIPANIVFETENNYYEGYISLRLNIKTVEYELLDEDNYELKDGLLILKNNTLTYKEFDVDDDFSLFLEAKQIPVNKKFLTTNEDVFSLSTINVCGIHYCELKVKDSSFVQYIPILNAVITSDGYIEIVDSSVGSNVLIGFSVKRKNGIYGLEIYYKQKE